MFKVGFSSLLFCSFLVFTIFSLRSSLFFSSLALHSLHFPCFHSFFSSSIPPLLFSCSIFSALPLFSLSFFSSLISALFSSLFFSQVVGLARPLFVKPVLGPLTRVSLPFSTAVRWPSTLNYITHNAPVRLSPESLYGALQIRMKLAMLTLRWGKFSKFRMSDC